MGEPAEILATEPRMRDQKPRRALVLAGGGVVGGLYEVGALIGATTRERTPISTAVAASAAVPVIFEPVRIDGVDYVDAAISKTAHAGLAIDRGATLVVLVQPLRPLVLSEPAHGHVRDGGVFAIASQALRIALERRLHEGLRRHAHEHPETDVVLLEPYERDLRLFDYPLMTYAIRFEIIRRGYRTTVKTILSAYERYAELFARHGIAMVPRAEIERRAQRWSSGEAGARAARVSEAG